MPEPVPVSVLMCVHNGERWLDETLDSVLNQDWPRFTVYGIENGSADGSLDLLKRREGARLKVFSLPEASKPRALNFGLDLVREGYVCLLDQDDLLTPGSLRVRAEGLDARPEVLVIHAATECFGEEGERWVEWWYEKDAEWLTDPRRLVELNFVNAGAAMWRREASPMFEEARWPSEDYAMWLHLFFTGLAAFTPACALRRRVHRGAVSSDREQSELMWRRMTELQRIYRGRLEAE